MVDICALCGRKTEMTFEHIPPRSCFNSLPAKPVSGDALINSMSQDKRKPWDTSGLTYKNQQSGMGMWSLCVECNSNTGSWYGNDYYDFIQNVNHIIVTHDVQAGGQLRFQMNDIFPLRIIKQMVSMVCSINQSLFEDERIKTLADFVKNRDVTGIDKDKYRIIMYVARNKYSKLCPLTVLFKKGNANNPIYLEVVSEIFTYPIGFVVCFNPKEGFTHDGIDITFFCDFEYDYKSDFYFSIPVLESYTVFPCDYRSIEKLDSKMSDNAREE